MTTLSGILPPVNVSTATGTLPANKGGTGLTSAGTAGNVLTSDGTGWVSSPASGGGASVVISENAPASPTEGTVWWDSDTGIPYIYYNDGNTSQWVSFGMGETGATGPAGQTGAQGPQGPQGEAGAVTCPQNVQNGNYTLVLADAGKHIYSANTGAQTITIPTNASVAFPIGTVITIVNMGSTRIRLGISGISIFPNGSTTALTACGILSGSTVQILKTATNSWNATFGTITPLVTSILSVAGGGSGGGYSGAGGGAGGYVITTLSNPTGTYTVTVGAGGALVGGFAVGNDGTSSSVTGTTTAVGGGGGGSYATAGRAGGSGGGGGGQSSTAGGAGTSGQGFAGGTGTSSTGGGGGGATSAGASGIGSTGGTGGAGLTTTITGTSINLAGGGGGWGNSVGGLGGNASAGRGGTGATEATAGAANSGSGGGGGNTSGTYYGYAGGSGVVIISTPDAAVSTTGSPVVTTVNGNTIYQFNSSGSITFA